MKFTAEATKRIVQTDNNDIVDCNLPLQVVQCQLYVYKLNSYLIEFVKILTKEFSRKQLLNPLGPEFMNYLCEKEEDLLANLQENEEQITVKEFKPQQLLALEVKYNSISNPCVELIEEEDKKTKNITKQQRGIKQEV